MEDNECAQRRGVHAGVVSVLVATMKAFRGNAHMQLRLLGSMSAIQESWRDVRNPEDAADALDAVVAALQAHASDCSTHDAAQIREAGMCAMSAMSMNVHVAAMVGPSGAITKVIACMQRQRTHVRLQTASCSALYNVLRINVGSQAGIAAAGGVKALTAALRVSNAQPATGDGVSMLWITAAVTLKRLLDNNAPNRLRALHEGTLTLLQYGYEQRDCYAAGRELTQSCATLIASLQSEADAHGTRDPGCRRCAELRARGDMCGHVGCTVRMRADYMPLQRCSRCMAAAYCSAAHQKEAWPEHKKACRRAPQPAGSDSSGAASKQRGRA
jgi:hypothetical protein